MHLDMKTAVNIYSGESATTEETDAVASEQDTLAKLWQSVDAKDNTFTNADVSDDAYNRHGMSGSLAVSQLVTPWYPFKPRDAFDTLNAVFGVKPAEMEDRILPKSEPPDHPADFTSGNSTGCWRVDQLASTAASSDSACLESDVRPLRTVASIVPTHFTSSGLAEPTVGDHQSSFDCNIPPPLVSVPSSLPSSGHVFTQAMSLGGDVLNTGHINLTGSPRHESSSPVCEDVSDSELEADDGHCSPPPELIYQEAHRSRNAM